MTKQTREFGIVMLTQWLNAIAPDLVVVPREPTKAMLKAAQSDD